MGKSHAVNSSAAFKVMLPELGTNTFTPCQRSHNSWAKGAKYDAIVEIKLGYACWLEMALH